VFLCKGAADAKARTLFETKDYEHEGKLSKQTVTILWREAGEMLSRDTNSLACGPKEKGFLLAGELRQYLTPIATNAPAGATKITEAIWEAGEVTGEEITKAQWMTAFK
jgi:hypothetical protein